MKTQEDRKRAWEEMTGQKVTHVVHRYAEALAIEDPDAQVMINIVDVVKCDLCGVIYNTGVSFKQHFDIDADSEFGTLNVPLDARVLLDGDAEDMLKEHWEEEHPGIPMVFVVDGQHARASRKGLVLP